MIRTNRALLSGSAILLISFGIFNVMGYFFHLIMARLLSIEDYGALATLFSIIYILAIFAESIQTIMTAYSSNEENKGKIKNLFKRTFNKALSYSFIIFLAYLLVSIPLSKYLKMPYALLALNGLIIFTIFLMPISRGILQGRKRFVSLGINMIVESTFKLLVPAILVAIGWGVYGAIGGVILATLFAFIFSFHPMKDFLRSREELIKTGGIYAYSKPVFVIILTLMIFYSLDIVMARLIFDETLSGYYSIASMISKIIFFATQPITKAMFPLISGKKNPSESSNIFLQSVLIVSLMIAGFLIISFSFPDFLVKMFSGEVHQESSSILFIVCLAMSLISMTNIILLYKISSNKTKNYKYLPLLIPVQVILFYFFSETLLQFSLALLASAAMFLWGANRLLR